MENNFKNPPQEFSLIPLWFWNDRLQEDELLRQMDDFILHGVHGFIIHPRVGLPRTIGFMSKRMMHFVRFAVAAAAERKMMVVLYDEGMYPSGSASGLVVKANPAHQCRCFSKQELGAGKEPELAKGQTLVGVATRKDGQRLAVIDRPVDAVIRGLHYVGRGPAEDRPPAGDILNPEAVRSFINIVYDGYCNAVGDYFGSTVVGVFTDEPSPLGKCREGGVMPGTTGFLDEVNRILGYDFTPHLPALWYDDEPDAAHYRQEYQKAVIMRLGEMFYRPLSEWCSAKGISLMGHPKYAMSIGLERHFHVPGQDAVWRWVLPKEANGLEGAESTQAKCSSSAMIHLGRRRNSNECYGAYGHEFSWEEMKTLADWMFVRGVNMLMPHAFYYSVRGPRRDERPPDVGPNSPWWDNYLGFARYCARLSWLNTDCRHICHIAILAGEEHLPWEAAKICFQNQKDFNYLEVRHLWEDAVVNKEGIHIRGMCYKALIVEEPFSIPKEAQSALQTLEHAGHLIKFNGNIKSDSLLAAINHLLPDDFLASPHNPDLRYRHVLKNGIDYYLLTNEGKHDAVFTPEFGIRGEMRVLDAFACISKEYPPGGILQLASMQSLIIEVS